MQPECTHYFLNLIKKPLALIMQLGRKVCMFLGFTNRSSVPPKSGLPVLSMLLLCQEEQHQSHRELGREMRRGFSRVKVDLRTPSQEKGHKRFIANHFQKVELKVVGFFHGFYQLRVPLLIWGRYIFKKPCTLLLLKATSASLLCETPTQTGNGTNGTRCQSEKKLSPINLLSNLFPVPHTAPGLPFFFICESEVQKTLPFPSVPSHAPDHTASSHLPQHMKENPQHYLLYHPGSLLGCTFALPPQTSLPNSLSVCFLIFRVTVSPAICSR